MRTDVRVDPAAIEIRRRPYAGQAGEMASGVRARRDLRPTPFGCRFNPFRTTRKPNYSDPRPPVAFQAAAGVSLY